jgi:hypothetical protein
MKDTEIKFNERVVELIETCDGSVMRKFYCIRDMEFGHWMSQEEFDGMIWTRDIDCRLELSSREEAEETLESFLEWRNENGVDSKDSAEILSELEAA